MRYVDSTEIDALPGKRLLETDRFSFRCHPALACFNQCCRNLNLILYPYDVIRLKNHLRVSSDIFLDQYADLILRPSNFFPEVLLRMSENREKTCPFLTVSGCSIYPNRPDTCRLFPIEQGLHFDADRNATEMIHFFRPPEFCLGSHENRPGTLKNWIADQQAEAYTKMTIRWAELKRLFQTDPWGTEGPNGPKAKMTFMATYNMDRFRDFVFNSSFLKRYKVKSAIRKKIETDDMELLKLGLAWAKFYLWGIKTPYLRLR